MAYKKQEYNRHYNEKTYHFLRIVIPKDKLQTVKDVSERKGRSISSLFVEAFETVYNVNLSRDK